MEIVLAILALFFVLSVVTTVVAVRAVTRGVRRTREQVSRRLAEATLAARASQPGPVGEVARLRRALRASLDATRATLLAGAPSDPALREALALLEQLAGHAGQLDRELAVLMNGEPDRHRIAIRVPELRERVERARKSADALRFAAQDRVRRHDDEGLDALQQQIEIEASALRHWKPALPSKPPPEAPEEGQR